MVFGGLRAEKGGSDGLYAGLLVTLCSGPPPPPPRINSLFYMKIPLSTTSDFAKFHSKGWGEEGDIK